MILTDNVYNWPMTHIVTDTTACFSFQEADRLGISMAPQVIVFGEDSYLEGVDMDIPVFLGRLKSSRQLPKTAAPPIECFYDIFKRLVPSGQPILCIHPSLDVSGTVRSAQTAAAEFPGADIRVIDTRLIASPLAVIVLQALKWIQSGNDADSCEAMIRALAARGKVYFLVDSLDFLARGGRIGGAQALLGGLLQIKPILVFKDGRVDQYEKERTHKHALERLVQIVVEQAPHNGDPYLTVLHAGELEQGRALAARLQKEFNLPQETPVYDMPPAIVTHAGPGILGVGFFVGA
jgi:DegV family protein with EDD domain